MVAPVIQFKRGLLANLPGLQAGEPGFTTDSYDLYVGLTSDTATNKFVGSHRYWTKGTSTTGSGVNLVEATNNGSSYITLASPASLAGIVTYYLPGTQGNVSSVLTNDGNGNLSWASGSADPIFTGIASFTDTTDNTLGDPDTGAVQIDGGLGVNKNVTIGQGLYVTDSASFNDVITPSSGNAANNGIQWESDIWGGSGDVAYIKYYSQGAENTRLEIACLNDSDDDIYLNTTEVNISNKLNVGGATSITGNTSVGGNLYVGGYSEFVGVVTFRGGTINLGDSNTDNINVSGEFVSNLVPNTDGNYDLGIGTQRWRNSIFSGIVTASSFVPTSGYIKAADGTNSIYIYSGSGNVAFQGTIGASQINNSAGNKVIGFSGTNNVTFENNASFAGIVTAAKFVGSIEATGAGTIVNATDISATNLNVSGVTTTGTANVTGNLTVGGDLFVNGSTTQVNTQTLTVEDALIDVGLVNGAAPNTDLNIDLGLLLNYYDGSAKKAAVYWDDSAARIVLASAVSESTGVLTPSSYAGLEIGSLFVNDCAGQSQVISCSGSTRNLINITIDCGTF